MDDLTKKKIENAKQILANGNCSAIECRFCLACPSEITGYCIAENKRRVPIDGLSDAGIDFFKSKIAEYEGSEMKYKVGDIVIAKKGLIPGHAYGSVAFFVDGMVPYCGRQMKIKKVHKDYYDVEENNFRWTDGMLEPVAIFKPSYAAIVVDPSALGQDETPFTFPVHVNGMTFNMIVDSAVGIKKHETRKEIRKRLLKL